MDKWPWLVNEFNVVSWLFLIYHFNVKKKEKKGRYYLINKIWGDIDEYLKESDKNK